MFTGLVSESGSILAEPSGQGGVRLAILHSAGLSGRLGIGASLAVPGVCLTVTDLAPVLPAADEPGRVRSLVEMSPETLARTTLGVSRPATGSTWSRPSAWATPWAGTGCRGTSTARPRSSTAAT